MLTDREIDLGIALPALVSIALTLIVVWLRWSVALPAVVGIAFMLGYWLLRQPEIPPQDGSDWLFWLAVPLALGSILFQRMGARWAALGAMAGVVVYVILRPITPAIGSAAIWRSSALAALWGTAASIALPWATRRIGAMWVVAALSITTGGAAVVVLSSNYRAYGVNGLGAAAAMPPVALGIGWMGRHEEYDGPAAVRGLSVIVIGILAGLLAGGRYYPQTGVSPFNFHALGIAPLLITLMSFLPGKRNWPRGIAAIVLVGVITASIAVPAAMAAIQAAETPDPF